VRDVGEGARRTAHGARHKAQGTRRKAQGEKWMKTNEAVTAFSQSEKIKAGLIWVSQILEFLQGLPDQQKQGGERVARILLGMVAQEIALAKVLTGIEQWKDAENHVEKAVVMVESGVAEESLLHLSRALSKVTNIAQESMLQLKESGLL
jgi:hypothetical protein